MALFSLDWIRGGGSSTNKTKSSDATDALEDDDELLAETEWKGLPSMLRKRRGHAAVALDDHRFMVLGGSNKFSAIKRTEIYDSRTNTWTRKPDLPGPRFGLAAVMLRGKVYALGGIGMKIRKVSRRVDVFDLETNRWEPGPPMPYCSGAHAATAVLDRYIYVSGGTCNGVNATAKQWLFDVESKKWEKLNQPLSSPRLSHNAVAVDDTVYVLGGANRAVVPVSTVNTVEAFNVSKRTWELLPSMNMSKGGRAAVALGRKIYVMGGANGVRTVSGALCHPHLRALTVVKSGCMATVDVYNIDTKNWTTMVTQMSVPRALFQAVVLGDSIVVIGGDGVVSNSVERLPLPKMKCGQEVTAQNVDSAAFFVKLLAFDKRHAHFKLAELVPLISDFHQLKIYYTLVACCRRNELLGFDAASSYITQALEATSGACCDEYALVVYKLILEKALSDGYLQRPEFLCFNNRAEITRLENATFIQDMQMAIKMNTQRIEGLEANLEAVSESFVCLARSLREKQKIAATVSFVSAILNAVSMGVGGSMVMGTFQAVVDFGDPTHIQTVVEECNSAQLMEEYTRGTELATKMTSEGELDRKLSNHSALAVVTAASVILNSQTSSAVSRTCNSNVRMRESMVVANQKKSASGSSIISFDDAWLDEEEEEKYPLHAAVKFGDIGLVEMELDRPGADMNDLDGKNRTAMDLAALSGQVEIMAMLERRGGKFCFKAGPRMKATARRRSSHVESYRQMVENSLL